MPDNKKITQLTEVNALIDTDLVPAMVALGKKLT